MRKRSKRSKSGTGAARRTKTTSGERPYPRPRRRFGQHFLEPAWTSKLIHAVNPSSDETFLEVGPGRGALTAALAPHVHRIVAVEVDRDLAAGLARRLPGNVLVVNADFLKVDLDELLRNEPRPVRVVGNLPYNISSPILFRLLDAAADGALIRDATVMLQREVVDRLAATPGTAAYGTLTLQAGLVADVEPLLTLPPGAFRPAPKVTSALVRLTFRPVRVDIDRPVFTKIARGIFVHRRKTLLNALRPISTALGRSAEEMIARAGLDPSQRPQTLTVADVARLSAAVL